MDIMINKDTQLCMSLSGRPSNFGTCFHNYLYQKMGLNFVYKAFTTTDIKAAIEGIRALGIRGCAISMPFKEHCIPYIDHLTDSAAALQSVNTIVNDKGYLTAYNTDYIAIVKLLTEKKIAPDTSFILKGSGGMAKAVAGALFDLGFSRGTILARNSESGMALANQYEYQWQKTEQDCQPAKLLINASPVGMLGGQEENELAFSIENIQYADTVLDVVAVPEETPLLQQAKHYHNAIISGTDIVALQAIEQFILYTGKHPTPQLFKEAANFARHESSKDK